MILSERGQGARHDGGPEMNRGAAMCLESDSCRR